MKPYDSRPNRPQAMPVARSSRRLPPFNAGDDVTEAIFLRVMLAIRDTVPALAHHPMHQLEELYGDLRNEIDEILTAAR